MASNPGARKSGSFIAVSDAPDPCRTPPNMAPVPYMIVANLDDALSVSPSVTFGGHPVVLAGESTVGSVTGDEAGTGGGVKSGCHGGEVAFARGSGSLRVNGKHVVREDDPVTMNKGNTTGRVVCLDGAAPTGSIGPGGQPTTDTNPPQPQPPFEESRDDQGAY